MNKPSDLIERGDVQKMLEEYFEGDKEIEAATLEWSLSQAIDSIAAVEGLTVQGEIVKLAEEYYAVIFNTRWPKDFAAWDILPHGTKVKAIVTKEE